MGSIRAPAWTRPSPTSTAHHSDAVLAVVTGDLTHWGEAEAYANFAEAMAALEMPYVAMVGNHDRREACLAGL